MKSPRLIRKLGRWAARGLMPNERLRWDVGRLELALSMVVYFGQEKQPS